MRFSCDVRAPSEGGAGHDGQLIVPLTRDRTGRRKLPDRMPPPVETLVLKRMGGMSVSNVEATSTMPAAGVGARIYSGLSALLVLLVIVQIFVASSGLFTMAHQLDNNQSYSVAQWNNSAYWGIHFFNAFAIAAVILLMVGTSFLARLSGEVKRMTGILAGLLVLQGILGFIPWPAPISALHVLNAFAMFGVAGYLARRTWAFSRRPA